MRTDSEQMPEMKARNQIAGLLFGVGMICAAVALAVILYGLRASPSIVQPAESVNYIAGRFMAAVQAEDYEIASLCLYGKPAIHSQLADSDTATAYLWSVFHEQLAFAVSDEVQATETGVCVAVDIQYCDMPAAIEAFYQQTAGASGQNDCSIQEGWRDLFSTISQGLPALNTTIRLNFVYEQGRWWIVPTDEVLNVLSCMI